MMTYLTVSANAGRTSSHPARARRCGASSMTSLEPPSVHGLAFETSKSTASRIISMRGFFEEAIEMTLLTLLVISVKEVLFCDNKCAGI